MNLKLYNALQLRMRADALVALSKLEELLKDPNAVQDNDELMSELISNAERLLTRENSINNLDTYLKKMSEEAGSLPSEYKRFALTQQKLDVLARNTRGPARDAVLEPDRSATMRSSIEKQKIIDESREQQTSSTAKEEGEQNGD